MAETASDDAATVGTADQNEWDVVDRTHHERMTELGILDKFVSPAVELASKKGVKARSKLRREHNDRVIRQAVLANTGVQSALQPQVRAYAWTSRGRQTVDLRVYARATERSEGSRHRSCQDARTVAQFVLSQQVPCAFCDAQIATDQSICPA
eukprot:1686340-Prymnesium_polylepis.1